MIRLIFSSLFYFSSDLSAFSIYAYWNFRIFPNKIRVKSDNLRRARRRMKNLQDDYKNGLKGMDEIGQSIQSWVSHLNYGDTYRLRKDIFRNLVFSQ